MPSSRSLITAPRFFIHTVSSRFHRLSAKKRKKRPRKLKNSTTPIHGWTARVIWPPPNRWVRKNSEGWNSAIPLNASRISETAVIQWLMRAAVV